MSRFTPAAPIPARVSQQRTVDGLERARAASQTAGEMLERTRELTLAARSQMSRARAGTAEMCARSRVLWHWATHDTLTGLPARSSLADRLEHALAAARRDASIVAVLFLDCDRFKRVNDTLGHDVGDRVILQAARRLLAHTRASDTVARIGGDEFAVVLRRLSHSSDADLVADRLLGAFRKEWYVDDVEIEIGASVGGVCTNGRGQPGELLAAADALMYEVKRRGGDDWLIKSFS